ncbi:nitric oxide-associated protein 1-like [Glandiceps talaboti]
MRIFFQASRLPDIMILRVQRSLTTIGRLVRLFQTSSVYAATGSHSHWRFSRSVDRCFSPIITRLEKRTRQYDGANVSRLEGQLQFKRKWSSKQDNHDNGTYTWARTRQNKKYRGRSSKLQSLQNVSKGSHVQECKAGTDGRPAVTQDISDIDQQYFGTVLEIPQNVRDLSHDKVMQDNKLCNHDNKIDELGMVNSGNNEPLQSDSSEIDQQYFGSYSESGFAAGNTRSTMSASQSKAQSFLEINDDFDNEIDKQYFGTGWTFDEKGRDTVSDKPKKKLQPPRRVETESTMFVDSSFEEDSILQAEMDVDVDKLERNIIKRMKQLLQSKGDLTVYQRNSDAKESVLSENGETLHKDFDYLSKDMHRETDIDELPTYISDMLFQRFTRQQGRTENELRVGSIQSEILEDDIVEVLKSLKKKRQPIRKPILAGAKKIFGTPDQSIAKSVLPCCGCGAVLHCQDIAEPGYLPSEKFRRLDEFELTKTLCQRCWLLTNHQLALNVNVKPEDFRKILSKIRDKNAMVICMIDLMDFPCSIFPNLRDVIGDNKPVMILGNKIDLLPKDSPKYLDHIRTKVLQECVTAGVAPMHKIKHIGLISAKSGFGIEDFITRLQQIWRNRGDVYLVGCTNVGKSSLFNQLLRSDYCKTKVSDIVQRATISIWPGTTLNLLKFPTLSPNPQRMAQRLKRLEDERKAMRKKMKEAKRFSTKDIPFDYDAYVRGNIGQTFEPSKDMKQAELGFDVGNNPFLLEVVDPNNPGKKSQPVPWKSSEMPELLHPNELLQAKWFYDTPGVINDNQILSKLNTQELSYVVPSRVLLPQTIQIKPSQVMFLAGLGRLDYIQGDEPILLTIFASHHLPIHLFDIDQADQIYEEHVGKELFKVPIGDKWRMASFPDLEGKDITIDGIGWTESSADIVFSSAGWAAVTLGNEMRVELKAYTPAGLGCFVRQPSLLPFAVNLRGRRERQHDRRGFYKIDKRKLTKHL